LELQSQLLNAIPEAEREQFLEHLEQIAKEASRQAGQPDMVTGETNLFPHGNTMLLPAPKLEPPEAE
jgi:hypothetical protein